MHSTKELMAEVENLRAEKNSREESSKLAQEKFSQEVGQLRTQIESLQSQVAKCNNALLTKTNPDF